jgi:hypothetical protein
VAAILTLRHGIAPGWLVARQTGLASMYFVFQLFWEQKKRRIPRASLAAITKAACKPSLAATMLACGTSGAGPPLPVLKIGGMHRRLNIVQPLAIIRARIGLRINRAIATTTMFMIAVSRNTKCQLPVESLMMLAIGTRKAEVPFAV